MFSRSLSRAYSTSPNKHIIDLLQKSLKEENSSPTRNAYKVRSFQNAIASIYEHNKPINSREEASKLWGIGPGIANRIDFFLQGKEYDEATEKRGKARLLTIEMFKKIPLIGIKTSTSLVNAGAASLSDLDLPHYNKLLSPSQKVNVKYRDHLTKPVSRSAAEDITAFVRDHISTNFEIHLTGAYRRDETDLPDVSILLHHKQHIHIPIPRPPPPPADTPTLPRVATCGKPPMPFLQYNPTSHDRRTSPLLQDVIRPLDASGLFTVPLIAFPNRWRGIALLPERNGDGWRDIGERIRDKRAMRGTYLRVDISLAPLKSRGAAQLALTGDYEFLRIAQLAAVRHGMHLDEYGLWRWHDSSPGSENENENNVGEGYWELVEGESEDRILDEIGLGVVPPSRRNFRYLATHRRMSARAGKIDLSVEQQPPRKAGRPRHQNST